MQRIATTIMASLLMAAGAHAQHPLQLLFQHRFDKRKDENGEYKIQVSTFQESIADLEKEFGKYGFAHKVDEEVNEYLTGHPTPPPLLGWGG